MFHSFNKMSALQMSVYAALLTVGVVAGWTAKDYLLDHDAMDLKSKTVTLGRDRLLNPLLACEVAETTLRAKQLRPFKYKIKKLVSERISSGMADEISVYFRDLDDGKVFSIDGDRGFTPASLGKVPIMIAYLKLAEDDPSILKKSLLYDGKKDLASNQYFKPRKNLEPGKSYTIDELIFRMIAYSDNNSWGLLLANINIDYLNSVVAELGASFIEGPSGEPLITVKSYSIFLRILYNASYLNRKMSQKALEYLAMEEFPLGIVASVPKGIIVASKFAERQYGVNGELRILHNYGIVYHPKQPYLICIMTKGHDFDQLASVIQEISKTVYDEIESQTGGT